MDRFQSLDEVIAALRRRALVIVVITLAGCVFSVLFALEATKSYEATAVLQIEDGSLPDELAGAGAEPNQSSRRVRLIEQRLMARDNLLGVMDKYDLFDAPGMSTGQRLGLMRAAARIAEIDNPMSGFGADAPSGLYITVRLEDPQKAADVANELMYSVIEQSRERSVSRARDTLDFFDDEENRVREEIEALESELAQFKRENAEQLPDGVIELRRQLSTLRGNELDLENRIVALQTDSERQRESVQNRNLALLTEQRALLGQGIAEVESLLAAAPEVERELSRRERELTQLQEEFNVIARRKAEAELGSVLENREQTDRFEVLETALVPQVSTSRSRRSVALIGTILSLMAGLGVAAVLEMLNPAIRTAAHMERSLGVSPAVVVPRIVTAEERRQDNQSRMSWTAGVALVLALVAWLGSMGGLGEVFGSLGN